MLDRIRQLPAEELSLEPYREEFRDNWGQVDDVFWKLERIQTFREPGHPSWEAWVSGNWDEATAITESRRRALVEHFEEDAARGIESRRLRIVEFPISPYLQWELNSQKVRTQAGQRTRVLEASRLGDLEANDPLPEVNVLGTKVLYEILYDDTGTHYGARKLLDPAVIHACRVEMASLYEQAEDLLSFFDREIAHLPPPIPDRV